MCFYKNRCGHQMMFLCECQTGEKIHPIQTAVHCMLFK